MRPDQCYGLPKNEVTCLDNACGRCPRCRRRQDELATAQARIAELEAKLVESSDLINTALNVLHIAWKRHDYVLNMPITDEQAQSHYDGATKLLDDAVRLLALEDE